MSSCLGMTDGIGLPARRECDYKVRRASHPFVYTVPRFARNALVTQGVRGRRIDDWVAEADRAYRDIVPTTPVRYLPIFSDRNAPTLSIEIRCWASVSRSRTVTVWSFSVSPSIVKQ